MKNNYVVSVGNIGNIQEPNKKEAVKTYNEYVRQSKSNYGRAAGESVTLFMNDEKTNELWSEVGDGLDVMEIRLPNHVGIAGTVFTSGKTINIPWIGRIR